MIWYDIETKINKLKTDFENLKILFGIEKIKEEIHQLNKEMMEPTFWNNQQMAKIVSKKIQDLKNKLQKFQELENYFEDLEIAIGLYEEDLDMIYQINNILINIERKILSLRMKALFTGEYDNANAFLTIHPGAGGTESQDWASMLLRMYIKWADKNNLKVEIIDFQEDDESGIRNATIKISGEYAYGKLKYEKGIHRLVRVSPFDSNNRRHTSFVSVCVIPELDENVEVEINPDDLKIDTYRASGAGGQHVNKTDSAVRITHIPTGMVVEVQNERSQHQNKANALKILKSKLCELEQQKNAEKMEEIRGEVKDNAWGNQIRSYILYPYTMVKDHRTGYETSNVQSVLDGNIDEFIEQELLFFAKNK